MLYFSDDSESLSEHLRSGLGLFSGGERKKVSIMNQNALQECNPEHVINRPLCYQTCHLKHLEFGMFNFHFVFFFSNLSLKELTFH